MDTTIQKEKKKPTEFSIQVQRFKSLISEKIVDENIRCYIFGQNDFSDEKGQTAIAYNCPQHPIYMKYILSLTFYFAYACYRHDMDFGKIRAAKMKRHNAKRIIKSLNEAFVQHDAEKDLIQYVLTDIQFGLADSYSDIKEIFGDITHMDMSRFNFFPYFKVIAEKEAAPARSELKKDISLKMVNDLLETLTFLHNYNLIQDGPDMFRFVSNNKSSCTFKELTLNHLLYKPNGNDSEIYSLYKVDRNSNASDNNSKIILKYSSKEDRISFLYPYDEENDDSPTHLQGQRSDEIYMELSGREISRQYLADKLIKNTDSISQIHAINYKYIKNLALAISDAISANDGSKKELYDHFGKVYADIFKKNGTLPSDINDLDWDTVVIMLLIEASPTAVLVHLINRYGQTFYNIVKNLYKRTTLDVFNASSDELDEAVLQIYKTKLVLGEAGGFGKIEASSKPKGKLLARARAMLIMSGLSLMEENDHDESLIYTGNLHSNTALLRGMNSDEQNGNQIRHACIILSETLKHLMCFYSGLDKYGERKADYDSKALYTCISKKAIEKGQQDLETAFFDAAKIKAEEIARQDYEADSPKDTLRLFENFINFCSHENSSHSVNSQNLYVAVGKHEIIDITEVKKLYSELKNINGASERNMKKWVSTCLEILEYFKTGSFSDTAYNHNLLNTIYPFTAAFNRKKENPDGYETINFALNVDIDNDNQSEYQQNINVLSEFTYNRNDAYYCLPNITRSNYKWWIDPVLISFRKFNDIFTDARKESH